MAGSQCGCDVVERTPRRTQHGAISCLSRESVSHGAADICRPGEGASYYRQEETWGDARQTALGGAFSEDLVQDDGVEPVTQPYLSLLRCCCCC